MVVFLFFSLIVPQFLGDVVWFPSNFTCHRGLPSTETISSSSSGHNAQLKRRRLIFWFSWSEKVLQGHVPEVDFQLNPWTLYSLLHEKLESDTVCLVQIYLYISDFSLSVCIESNPVVHVLDGSPSLPTLWEWIFYTADISLRVTPSI